MIFTKQATLFLVSASGILSGASQDSRIIGITAEKNYGTRMMKKGNKSSKGSKKSKSDDEHTVPKAGSRIVDPLIDNLCKNSNPNADDIDCFDDIVAQVGQKAGPQAGINITVGYDSGTSNIPYGGAQPITTSYFTAGLCPVNVHWHSGAEHYSGGEYDCTSPECGPGTRGTGNRHLSKYGLLKDDEDNKATDESHRGLDNTDDDGPSRQGFRCNDYDENDPKFTTKYDFKFCKGTVVGETYEVHWPHSSSTFAQCNTPNQYQTPFYKGVFCNWPTSGYAFPGDVENGFFSGQDVASSIGVQGQVFTIVNDERYYYPDLFRGAIDGVGDFFNDVAIYLGSSTGSDRNNTKCSMYSPITWQMDRKCHLISASSFDKLCEDMLSQTPTNMLPDTEPAGARELVSDKLTDPTIFAQDDESEGNNM